MAKAYVPITCDSGSEDFVISSLKSTTSVKMATGVFGTYDVISTTQSSDGLITFELSFNISFPIVTIQKDSENHLIYIRVKIVMYSLK